jgi:hypothetical protein
MKNYGSLVIKAEQEARNAGYKWSGEAKDAATRIVKSGFGLTKM